MYVAGEWRGAAREEEIRSPYDGEVVGVVPVADAADAELAVAAAVDGARAMRALSAFERSEILRRAADAIERDVDELARTIALEVGKPLAEARGEAARIPPLLRTSAAEGARMHGETVPVDAAANGAGKLALHDPAAVRRRRRDLAVQLSRAARRRTRSGPRSRRATRSCSSPPARHR